MHPLILGAGALVAAAFAGTALAACPAPRAALSEQFIPADCPHCWAAPGNSSSGNTPPGWRLDWITPAGDDAALSAASLSDAADRARRAGLPEPANATQALQRAALPARPGWSIQVAAGPAWHGYFGLQLTLRVPQRTAWPAGSRAWLALVEVLPAGTEGTAQPRALVRSVAGPLPIDVAKPGQAFTHLRALRWPESAQPERLQARAWLEAPDGRVLAMAANRCN